MSYVIFNRRFSHPTSAYEALLIACSCLKCLISEEHGSGEGVWTTNEFYVASHSLSISTQTGRTLTKQCFAQGAK